MAKGGWFKEMILTKRIASILRQSGYVLDCYRCGIRLEDNKEITRAGNHLYCRGCFNDMRL